MAVYHRFDGLQSPAGWLPVHRNQLRAQRLKKIWEFYVAKMEVAYTVGARTAPQ